MEEIILLENRGSCPNPGFEVVCDGMRAYFGDHLSGAIDRIDRLCRKSKENTIRLNIYSDDMSIKDQYFAEKPYFNSISVSKWSPFKFYEQQLQGTEDISAGEDESCLPLRPVEEIIRHGFKTLERVYEARQKMPVFRVYNDLNRLVAKLKPSEFRIVMGVDKTDACIYIAKLIAVEAKTPLAVFSPWTTKEDLCMAMLFSIASVDYAKCMNGRISESDWPKLIKARAVLSDAPIFVDDTRYASVKDMRDKAEKLKNSNRLGLIITGYSPNIYGDKAIEFKNMASELGLPVIALA